jgi:hypothetical protein
MAGNLLLYYVLSIQDTGLPCLTTTSVENLKIAGGAAIGAKDRVLVSYAAFLPKAHARDGKNNHFCSLP